MCSSETVAMGKGACLYQKDVCSHCNTIMEKKTSMGKGMGEG